MNNKDYYIRFSRSSDKEQIKRLTMLCFGDRDHYDILKNIENQRYLLAFTNGMLVAMTGLIWSNEYNGLEVDWTCTHPDYQHKGIMHNLFERICTLTDEDIYCSCWRYDGFKEVNLHSLMRDFGFEAVLEPRVTWDTYYNCSCGRNGYCCHQTKSISSAGIITKNHCRCYEDLYIRRT